MSALRVCKHCGRTMLSSEVLARRLERMIQDAATTDDMNAYLRRLFVEIEGTICNLRHTCEICRIEKGRAL